MSFLWADLWAAQGVCRLEVGTDIEWVSFLFGFPIRAPIEKVLDGCWFRCVCACVGVPILWAEYLCPPRIQTLNPNAQCDGIWMGLLGGDQGMRVDPHTRPRCLIKKIWGLLGSYHVEPQWEDGHLWTTDQALTTNRICQHLNLGLGDILWPPSLWYFCVIAAWWSETECEW